MEVRHRIKMKTKKVLVKSTLALLLCLLCLTNTFVYAEKFSNFNDIFLDFEMSLYKKYGKLYIKIKNLDAVFKLDPEFKALFYSFMVSGGKEVDVNRFGKIFDEGMAIDDLPSLDTLLLSMCFPEAPSLCLQGNSTLIEELEKKTIRDRGKGGQCITARAEEEVCYSERLAEFLKKVNTIINEYKKEG